MIGCGGRAAAAAAAVVGTYGVEFFFAIFLVRNNSVPTALLCARYTTRCVVLTMTASGTTYKLLEISTAAVLPAGGGNHTDRMLLLLLLVVAE